MNPALRTILELYYRVTHRNIIVHFGITCYCNETNIFVFGIHQPKVCEGTSHNYEKIPRFIKPAILYTSVTMAVVFSAKFQRNFAVL